MKRGGILVCLLCLGGVIAAVGAINDTGDSSATKPSDDSTGTEGPYSAIWMRNVFDLKPADPPATNNVEKDTAPPPNIKLEGITTIFGKRQALFLVQAPQAPGKAPNKEESYMLSEGERRGPLEVVEINPKARNVKIKNDGIESTLTFETNHAPAGVSGPGGAQVAAPLGMPTPPQRGFGRPGGPGVPLPINRPIRGAANGGQNGYSPTMTPQNIYNGGANYGGYAGGTPAVGSGGGVNLGSLFNQPQQSSTIPQQSQPPDMPIDQQITQVLANQVANGDKIKAGLMPSLPIPSGVPDPLAPEPSEESTSLAPPAPSSSPIRYPPGYGPRTTGTFATPGAP